MLNVTVDHDLYRYEIHALTRAFYPAEEVKVLLEDDASVDPMKEIFLAVRYSPEAIALHIRGSEYRCAAPDKVRFDTACPETKDHLKHLLYNTFCGITGHSLPWGELIGIRPTKLAKRILEQGGDLNEAASFMQDKYAVSPEKAKLSAEIAAREISILEPVKKGGFSLYIGIPFCPTTCMYCSFPSNSLAVWKDRVGEYLDALYKEMEETAALMKGLRLDTVYFGGGTPTAVSASELDALLAKVHSLFDTSSLLELTVEAGRPDTIDEDKLQVMKDHGVSRISINPQTKHEQTLKRIGRAHTSAEIETAFAMARKAGFDNINMDLILGLPGEDVRMVKETLAWIRDLSPDSVTAHTLAIKRGSALAQDPSSSADAVRQSESLREMIGLAADCAEEMGMKPYYLYRQKNMLGNFENVGYAADGKAGIYNILIMEEIQSIPALGAGSISKRVAEEKAEPDRNGAGSVNKTIVRRDNVRDIDQYISRIGELIERKKLLFSCNRE